MPAGSTPSFSVLLICTGNICRSAFGERLGRAFLDEALGAAAAAIGIRSAGTRAVVGSAMHPDTALVLQGFGGDPDGFAARQFAPEMATGADLILAMTREHRRAVLEQAPRALSRTFTLVEAADLVTRVDADPPGVEPAERSRALVARLAAARAGRHGGSADDVPDPIRRPLVVHEAVGELIAAKLLPLLARLAGAKPL